MKVNAGVNIDSASWNDGGFHINCISVFIIQLQSKKVIYLKGKNVFKLA